MIHLTDAKSVEMDHPLLQTEHAILSFHNIAEWSHHKQTALDVPDSPAKKVSCFSRVCETDFADPAGFLVDTDTGWLLRQLFPGQVH